MNDRCISLLENYEVEVQRTYKGRGSILCESDQGLLTFREYNGYQEKVAFQDALLHRIRERGFLPVESIIRNKDGGLLTEDLDGSNYLLKTYIEGRECNVSDLSECKLAMETLAKLHKVSEYDETLPPIRKGQSLQEEFEKHNRELKKIRRFLKDKGQKNDFEIALLKQLGVFLEKAEKITEECALNVSSKDTDSLVVCHGDYQHHNLIFSANTLYILNFEKCVPDNPVRDIYLFLRKLLEKSDWSSEIGFSLLKAYEEERPLEKGDYKGLYYRLAYPDKFWKIANFYYNSSKAWMPEKNQEKLFRVCEQEKNKEEFLRKYMAKYAILE